METHDEIIQDLVLQFKEHRDAIITMIQDVEKIKEKIDLLFPESLDKRYMRFLDEKIKSATEMFKLLLDLRKEIIKSTKDEIELRRKIKTDGNKENDILDFVDIKKIMSTIEQMNKNKSKLGKQFVNNDIGES